MSAGPSLHSMHSVEKEKPRSRGQRIAYYLPLALLMVAVLVMAIIGLGARQGEKADAAQRRDAALTQPSQSSTLAASCVSAGFPEHPADIWTGDRNAASEAVFAAHPEVLGMRAEGRDGFEFWGDAQSYNISQALGRAPWLDDQLGQWLVFFDELDSKLKDEGRNLVILVAPAKWELYRDKLPAWTDDLQGKTHLEQFLEHSGDLPVVDVRAAMRTAMQEAPVYSAVNTHWTPFGAYAAWQQTVACASDLYPDSLWSKLSVPTPSGVELSTAPNEFTAYGSTATADDWATPVLPAGGPIESTITGTDGTAKPGPSDGAVGLLEMPASTDSTTGTGRALIMRDSTGEALAPVWAQAFAHTCQVRHMLDYPDQRPDIVAEAEKCDADTVIYVFTERYFAQFPPSMSAG